MPPASAQQMKQAQQQMEQTIDQFAQAHGLLGGGWGAILGPILVQLIQAVVNKLGSGTPSTP